jgi:subfamily B ATP-binding cassette protein MsbA
MFLVNFVVYILGTPNATNDEIIEAAKAADAHDFIVNLEDG